MLSGKPEINCEEDYNIIFVITSYKRLVFQYSQNYLGWKGPKKSPRSKPVPWAVMPPTRSGHSGHSLLGMNTSSLEVFKTIQPGLEHF